MPNEQNPDFKSERDRMLERMKEVSRRIQERVKSVRETHADADELPTEDTKEQPRLSEG